MPEAIGTKMMDSWEQVLDAQSSSCNAGSRPSNRQNGRRATAQREPATLASSDYPRNYTSLILLAVAYLLDVFSLIGNSR